jgi:hypothetical protein
MKFLILLAAATSVFAGSGKITYSKDFPGSNPAFVMITLEHDGTSVYKESLNDELPLKFTLDEAEAAEIFRLADKLDHFSRPLESGLKVAKMGTKSFLYEDEKGRNEVKFNYSQDLDAQLLHDWFEKITESEQRFIHLERAVKFDKLGVNQELLLLEVVYDQKRLMAPDQFLPLLDRVAKNESYMHMARERAARLADTFRARKGAKPE